MACRADLIGTVNFVLCMLILLLGCRAYVTTKKKDPFYIGVAFGLFAVSHYIGIFGMERAQQLTVILIRLFAYVIVAFTLLHRIETDKK